MRHVGRPRRRGSGFEKIDQRHRRVNAGGRHVGRRRRSGGRRHPRPVGCTVVERCRGSGSWAGRRRDRCCVRRIAEHLKKIDVRGGRRLPRLCLFAARPRNRLSTGCRRRVARRRRRGHGCVGRLKRRGRLRHLPAGCSRWPARAGGHDRQSGQHERETQARPRRGKPRATFRLAREAMILHADL